MYTPAEQARHQTLTAPLEKPVTDAPDLLLKKTPLDALHRELGAKMVPFAGYEMPLQYRGIIAEHLHARSEAVSSTT